MRETNAGVKWFNTTFYPNNKTGRAVLYEEGILPRLHSSKVTLFTPWGPRYSYEKRGVKIGRNDKEVKALQFLAETLTRIKEGFQGNVPTTEFRWIFLGADLYGTRINNLPEDIVAKYFESLEECLKEILPEAEFFLWSNFDKDAEEYREKIRENIRSVVGNTIFRRSIQTAQNMGLGGDPHMYLVERIAEAMLIEERFKPIKVSCVPRHKDDKVDGELPRLYLVPEELHAPWI